MKRYHLTILRNGEYKTIFGEMTSITNFLLIEKELGHDTVVLFARELMFDEWELLRYTKHI